MYMQQRYYEPLAGRFLSVDPVVTDAKDGTSFNRYVYGNNNPYKFKDPDGQFAQVAVIGAGVLLVGAAICGPVGASWNRRKWLKYLRLSLLNRCWRGARAAVTAMRLY